nr:nuclear pore complex protein NUP98A [Tanacetum cinerariifolium]
LQCLFNQLNRLQIQVSALEHQQVAHQAFFCQNNNFGQMPTNQSPIIAQPQSITNPFRTLPAMPQMSIGRVGNAHSVQYGISSLPQKKIMPLKKLERFFTSVMYTISVDIL